ncbi:DNA-deoxyinosine glycosylase [Methylophaga sp.]|uniref:DNA-deoxyinosine glycosylase n=1 Tax=Methylophaga sp. TaxID=2024840 RepID=UPI003F69FD1A
MTVAKPLSFSFSPIVGPDASILILGSMPGTASLEAGQYYAHSRNAFWPIMAELFGLKTDWPYKKRCAYLAEAGVAIWDVLKACHRPGSLDQHIDIKTMQANDFIAFLSQNSGIKAVFFNGAKAEQVFKRFVLPDLTKHLVMEKLPSTSPAHAALKFEDKLKAWQKIKAYC